MNTNIESYFESGCGRCPLGGTPQCKVHTWQAEMAHLRKLLLDSELIETVKWGVPCYTFQGKNVLILSAFKDYCSLSFFKGVLLADPAGVLEKQGENSQAARLLRFTTVQAVTERESIIKSLIEAAIEIEKSGQQVNFKSNTEQQIPEELQQKFRQDPEFKKAFASLTPGRQRGYVLHFTSAKQSQTRLSRIEKCLPAILSGKGLNDR